MSPQTRRASSPTLRLFRQGAPLAKMAKSLPGARQRLCGLISDLVIFSRAAHSGEKRQVPGSSPPPLVRAHLGLSYSQPEVGTFSAESG